MNTVAFITFGCKLNYAESSEIERKFRHRGYKVVDFHDRAGLYVIHSCVVTALAERKCVAAIRQAKKLNPDARVAVIGCMAEMSRERLRQQEGADLILGNEEKFRLDEIADGRLDAEDTNHIFHPSYSQGGRSRTFFKIQDGCDYFCNYCIIPYARGHSRSATVKQSIALINEATAGGCNELVLTGVNIGDYGRRNGESLLMLLDGLKDNENIKRIRLSSVEPDLLDEGIIGLFASEKRFMPHFHIPLQSGSDRVLKAMGRRYTTALFTRVSESIKKQLPHACIGTDIICGFPGESNEDFNDTLEYLEKSALSYMHIFRYSERPGTRAATMKNEVSSSEISRRSIILLDLANQKKILFYQAQIGNIREVLLENNNVNGSLEGYSDNYIRVMVPYKNELRNSLVTIKINNINKSCIASGDIIYT